MNRLMLAIGHEDLYLWTESQIISDLLARGAAKGGKLECLFLLPLTAAVSLQVLLFYLCSVSGSYTAQYRRSAGFRHLPLSQSFPWHVQIQFHLKGSKEKNQYCHLRGSPIKLSCALLSKTQEIIIQLPLLPSL